MTKNIYKSGIVLLLIVSSLHSTAQIAEYEASARDTITDNNFTLPEGFEENMKATLDDWYLLNYTAYTPATSSETQNVNYPDSVYIQRLSQLPTEIDMPYNQVVRRNIDYYTLSKRTALEAILGRSAYYMPIFEMALEKEGLPLELKYLAVIESALKPTATSRVGAAGLWQFMIPTGRMMGLEINSLIDERRDPYKSSEAAARYLKMLYEMYNDWHLALAAYNCGPGNVNKAIRRSDGKTDFWEIYNYLPRETRGYVPIFIAANYAMTYYNKHNINPVLAAKPLITDTIMVTHDVHFDQIAHVLNIPIEALRELNPQYRKDRIPGHIKPYSLTLPSQQVYAYLEMQDSILAYDAEKYAKTRIAELPEESTTTQYHKVRKGETLSSIAKKYGTTVKKLQQWNGLKGSMVRQGRRLIVGMASKPVATTKTKKNNSSAQTEGNTSYHTVRKGETLWTISQKYSTTTDKLKSANKLKGNTLKVGQKLKIPQ